LPKVIRLRSEDNVALHELLKQNPCVNIFLKGFLDAVTIDRAWWYGVRRDGQLQGAVLVLPGRLAVPWIPHQEDAILVGQHLARHHQPSMLVGPRVACDAIWSFWKVGISPISHYDQRLYTCTEALDGVLTPGFRKATPADLDTVTTYAARMEEEDLGTNPLVNNPTAHSRAVLERIRAGRTYVIEHGDKIVFQIVIGSKTSWGCQVGGTYVPPEHRSRGWATKGMDNLCRLLLKTFPRVTLHVNEANTPAVKVYERSLFQRGAAYRLIVL
jgi:uncharacterized protein